MNIAYVSLEFLLGNHGKMGKYIYVIPCVTSLYKAAVVQGTCCLHNPRTV